MSARRASVVIPCFNEAERLDRAGVLRLLEHDSTHLVLVDDGSTDTTAAVLADLAGRSPARIDVLQLHRNGGKAAAVRAGLRRAIDDGAVVVGYFDADLATTPEDMSALIDLVLDDPTIDAAFGSRVALLGRRIERNELRHWAGRGFATLVSHALRIPVYDTQCGAKAFRVTNTLRAALDQPFRGGWGFDVELLGRLLTPMPDDIPATPGRIVEVPLSQWTEVRGSKLRLAQVPTIVAQLTTVLWSEGWRRRRHASAVAVEIRNADPR